MKANVSPSQRAKLFLVASALAKGMGPTDALLEAGYSEGTARGKSIRWTDEDGKQHKTCVTKHPLVIEYLEDMQGAARERLDIDVDNIVAKLERVFNGAFEDRRWDAARAAAFDQAKLLGLVVDRKHVTVKPIDQMSEAECRAVLGEDAGSTLH